MKPHTESEGLIYVRACWLLALSIAALVFLCDWLSALGRVLRRGG